MCHEPDYCDGSLHAVAASPRRGDGGPCRGHHLIGGEEHDYSGSCGRLEAELDSAVTYSIMSATQERDLATDWAKTDNGKALALAQKVSKPWFRCQALAAVVRYGPDSDILAIAGEAIAAAALCDDAYKRVAVTAWPIRALSERGQLEEANRMLMRSLGNAREIEQPVNRVDALELLWHAAWIPPVAGRVRALDELIEACKAAPHSWRAGRCMRNVARAIGLEDPARAARIVASMPDGAYKRQAAKWPPIAERSGQVRPFFW